MKRTLMIVSEIDAGEATCASVPGKFCAHARASRFGTRYHCALFGARLDEDTPAGWLQRLPACLEADRKFYTLPAPPTEPGRFVRVVPGPLSEDDEVAS